MPVPSIRAREEAIYTDIWAVDAYAAHSPGVLWLPVFQDMARPILGATILDAGCGAGQGALALEAAGYHVRCCDLTPTGVVPEAAHFPFTTICLWDDLRPALHRRERVDWIYCCDVLEHLPTALTMLAVVRLLDVAERGVFLTVSFEDDNLGAWIGETLHRTVQPFVWWRDHLAAVGALREARDLLNVGAFLVGRR